ncbi:hypothetical protein [Paracoccus siganidrum]|uniref:Uncharacterized protein n=1 Tax=Paracoccus siganidrum TaxID=1276757 RepID=A0A419AAP6_9RHOB|nr:hypothetical protein [Paracoccus siganidrum]RJL20138.1 hypothetical protein D3P05_04005 [Paracoccus siganidrum]RMC32565.1 hypothetical protein C9E82_14700 [Paracoccus siganidrum]
MSDYLLLGGIALGVLSILVAVVQLLQTRPPRAAAITLVLAIVALLAGAWLAPEPFRLSQICDAWTRVTGGVVAPAEQAAPEAAEPEAAEPEAAPEAAASETVEPAEADASEDAGADGAEADGAEGAAGNP